MPSLMAPSTLAPIITFVETPEGHVLIDLHVASLFSHIQP